MTVPARTPLPGVTLRLALPFGLLLAPSACHIPFGPTPEMFEPAQRPSGVHATLRLPHRVIEGELLELRDTTLLLLTPSPPRLVVVPIADIRIGQFDQRRERVVRGRFRSESDRTVIGRLSRFPAGMPESALARLLEAYGQSAPEVVR